MLDLALSGVKGLKEKGLNWLGLLGLFLIRFLGTRPVSYVTFFFLSALILEEIAIDTPIRDKEEEILKEAQELHLASLELARYGPHIQLRKSESSLNMVKEGGVENI